MKVLQADTLARKGAELPPVRGNQRKKREGPKPKDVRVPGRFDAGGDN